MATPKKGTPVPKKKPNAAPRGGLLGTAVEGLSTRQQKIDCLSGGGTWDAKTKTCR